MKTIEKQVLIQCSDVEMKLNVGKCILSILIIIAGIFVYALASYVQCEDNNTCNILIFVSVVTIFFGIKMTASNSRRLYYAPTRSCIKYYSFHIDRTVYDNINSYMVNNELLMSSEGLLFRSENDNCVECMISDDGNFVAIGSSDNMNFYSNISSGLMLYFDAEAQKMAEYLKDNYVENKESAICH